MRPIDANSLRRLFDTLSKNKWNKSSFTSWAIAYETAKAMVDDEVTVDAVPVVRCKDCKWWNTTENEKCVAYDAFWVTDPDDFCCWGERREQDEKDCERCLQVTERPGNDICKACGGRRGQDATRVEESDLRDLRE